MQSRRLANISQEKSVRVCDGCTSVGQRGTANCTVAISDDEIASPVASAPDFVVVMNQPSLVRFQNQVQSGGVLFVNSSLVDIEVAREDVEVIRAPATAVAEEMGSPKSANMVMMGVFVGKTGLVSLSSVVEGIKTMLEKKKRLIDINQKALTAGHGLL